ncbi:hypothetical protein [Streptomyces sp. NPDC058674]|uniref:hypothetical protein n=1 Tax=Streptomyces sp. NPDC058674 TaxID=3346592 RepID=UPI0036625D07
MTAPIDWGDEPPTPQPVGPHAWAEHYNKQREQAPAGRKLLDQLSDRELVALYERAEQAEAAIERARTLHRSTTAYGRPQPICSECSSADELGSTDNAPVDHPCRTLAALDGPKEPTP